MIFSSYFGRSNERPDWLSPLHNSREAIAGRLHELAALACGSMSVAKCIVKTASKALGSITGQVQAPFRRLSENRDAARIKYRGFQVDHGLTHEACQPDIFWTVVVTQGALLVEASAAAALLVADGTMDVVSAMINGTAFAAITIGIGTATGYFACRFLGYRINAPFPKLRDVLIRAAAWFGFGAGLVAIGGMGFAAARVRATGGHSDIWNWGSVPLSSTFSDYFAIALPVVGLLGASLAIYKGWTGIKDYPGYLEAKRASDQDILLCGENLRCELEELTEAVYAEALEAFECELENCDEAEDQRRSGYREVADLITVHNLAVEAARDEARRWTEAECNRVNYISQRNDASVPTLCENAFDELLVPEIDPSDYMSDPDPGRSQSGAMRVELEAAYSAATTRILESYSELLIDAPRVASKDEKGE